MKRPGGARSEHGGARPWRREQLVVLLAVLVFPACGTTPTPFLPVLSATSCSIQRLNVSSFGGMTSVSLSRPSRAAAPMSRPKSAAGFGPASPLSGFDVSNIAAAHSTSAEMS